MGIFVLIQSFSFFLNTGRVLQDLMSAGISVELLAALLRKLFLTTYVSFQDAAPGRLAD